MKKELLEVEHEKMLVDIPLLDEIFIIPTRRKHDSGYKCMEIIGANINGNSGILRPFDLLFYDNPTTLFVFINKVCKAKNQEEMLKWLNETGNQDIVEAIEKSQIQIEWE